MKRYQKVNIESFSGAKKYLWAIRMFFIAISMSLFFGFISQTLLSSMGIAIASLCIFVFIFIAVVFDMIGIAAASADINQFEKWTKEKKKGADVAFQLCKHSEKVCSFCADVVGDICSTLCGAGGACIVAMITNKAESGYVIILISIFTSALIAGLTVFFKAIMKERALKKSNHILLKIGKILNIFNK